MNDPYHKSGHWERASEDPYLNAACWERAWEQKERSLSSLSSLRSQHVQLDEADWAPLERGISDGAIFRRCGRALLDLGRRSQALLRLRHRSPVPRILLILAVLAATLLAGAPARAALPLGSVTFRVSTLAAGQAPSTVATADMNGDGKPDLVAANQGSDSFAVGARPVAIATGDFNGDGMLDLVTANAGGNSVSVLLAEHQRALSTRQVPPGAR